MGLSRQQRAFRSRGDAWGRDWACEGGLVDWVALATAVGGGMWGAAVGAVPAFIFTGILAMLGAVAALSGHTELVGVAFGPAFGPHVSFGGGVCGIARASPDRP